MHSTEYAIGVAFLNFFLSLTLMFAFEQEEKEKGQNDKYELAKATAFIFACVNVLFILFSSMFLVL